MKLAAAIALNLAVLAVTAPTSTNVERANPVEGIMEMLNLGQQHSSSAATPTPTPTVVPNSNMNFPGEKATGIQQHGAASSAVIKPTESSHFHVSAAATSSVSVSDATASASSTPSASASAKPESPIAGVPIVGPVLANVLGL
ncbi:uncharacterized protein APUU_70521A [Aspergillus puulaauensis]|uniref:Uncharacterized protein n=1 Tax=Aspergillus puulaauensis TaxID=1220207 RepID=A0A7R7XWE3_9EURO|nr:uncharacterized protein APUU_70521A [Aspergillus puulaauensis]BCS28951.1 hypothetical protein APUU_70521A [Aspergillus puulaauensis]